VEADHSHPMVIIKFDFKNAFNMMNRKFLLNEIKNNAPMLLPMLQQSYGKPSNLFYNGEVILSQRGVQQGDPLGPPAFCIGALNMTQSLLSRLNGWYLDDGIIGDELEIILDDIKTVLEFCDVSGMLLNTSKCEVFFVNPTSLDIENHMMSQINNLLPGVRKLDRETFELLGASIFHDGLTRVLQAKTDTVKLMCERLKILNVHPALCLFKHSLASPKFLFILRTGPTFLLPQLLLDVDEIFRSSLEFITNTKMDEVSWRQASLPLSFSGLGIRKVSDLAIPAYLSSLYNSVDLSNKILQKFCMNVLDQELLNVIQQIPNDCIPETDDQKKVQKNWDMPRMKLILDDLLNNCEPIDRARLLASCKKESSKWLQVVPSEQLGLFLDNNAVRIAVALRLGSDVCEEYKCECGEEVNKKGRHGLSCKKAGGRLSRHGEINKIISKALSSAGYPNILEPPGISRVDGKRPDGMTLVPWHSGRSLLWDVTIGDTLALSYVSMSSNLVASVAEQAERRKHNHYADLKEHHHFTPIAFETLGAMGSDTEDFIKILGKLIFESTGERKAREYLLQRISIAIQRGNAACILGTFGTARVDSIYLL
jgi:hypothetical protein